jgi:hypothetical protein
MLSGFDVNILSITSWIAILSVLLVLVGLLQKQTKLE